MSTQTCAAEDAARLLELSGAVGEKMLIRVLQAVCEARKKHPDFAPDFAEGMKAVESEFYEFKAQAMLVQRPDGTLRLGRLGKAEAELIDVIATGLRTLGREYANAPAAVRLNIACDNQVSPSLAQMVGDIMFRGGGA